jgi:hypothetical protein
MKNPLEAFARHVGDDPFFLASLLNDYVRSQGLNDVALATYLGCRLEDWTALRLCGAPDPDPPGFEKDIGTIAGHFGLDCDRLAEVVRRGQVLQRLRGVAGPHGTLMAARDDEPPLEETP